MSNCSVVILVVLDLKFSVELEVMIFGAKVDAVVMFEVTLALLLLKVVFGQESENPSSGIVTRSVPFQ